MVTEALATEPDDPSAIPGTHVVPGEKDTPYCSLTSNMCLGNTHPHSCTHTWAGM